MSIIKLKNVNKSFGFLQVLNDISFEIKQNQILCIVGPSGCGKSTILNLLSGIYVPDNGEISQLNNLGLSYVFQNPRLLPWRTIKENMKFVLEDKFEKDECLKRVDYWLKAVELSDYGNLYPKQLSGGMKQRAALARAFCVSGNLLLMDEPFKGLDEPLRLRMIKLVFELWKKEPKSIIFVTHDIREAILLGHSIVVLTEKPTKVIEQIDINLPHEDRNIGCRKISRIEEYIYNLLDKDISISMRSFTREKNYVSNT